MRLAAALALLLLLTACQTGAPADGPAPGGPAPVAAHLPGGAITVTTLDAPPPDAPAADDTPDAALPVAVLPDPEPDPETTPEADPEPEPEPAAAPIPEALKSAAQIKCEKQNGTWSLAAKSGAMTCIRQTTDAGKPCDRQSDCDGMCLARSRTCAPFKPLLGCNEILQDNGLRVTLCID